jgi:hypothetical protein
MVAEFLSPLWVTDLLSHVGKSPPMAPIPNHINPFHTPISNFVEIQFNVILPSTTGSSKHLFPLSFLAGILHVFLTKIDGKIIYSDSHIEDRVRTIGRSLASSRLPVRLSLFARIYTRGSTERISVMFDIGNFCTDMSRNFNPLNAELNPICHLLALLGGATIVVVSRLRVNFG